MKRKLKVSLFDENTVSGDKCIASGLVSLQRFASALDNIISFNINLNDNGVICGRLDIRAVLKKASKREILSSVPESRLISADVNGTVCFNSLALSVLDDSNHKKVNKIHFNIRKFNKFAFLLERMY